MVSIGQLNPLGAIGINSIAITLLVVFIAVFVLGMIGAGVFVYAKRKQLKYTIPLYKKVGGRVMRVATYKAKDYRISLAGDKLWFIPKIKKYIPPATIQSAPNEFPHYEREDGEWINFNLEDIDERMKEAKAKFVHQDMRSQRVAIGELLERRFQNQQSWWEKYGHLVTHVIFYLVVAVAMVIIFYQFSEIVSKVDSLMAKIVELEEQRSGGNPANKSLVPASILLIVQGGKRWLKRY